MVFILAQPFLTTIGLPIGSPSAAGGASLVAAWKEFLFQQRMDANVRPVFSSTVLILRWMDDVAHAYPDNITEPVRNALRELQTRNFYGDKLSLLPQETTECFGFRFTCNPDIIQLRSRANFVRDPSLRINQTVWPPTGVFHGPPQFRSLEMYRTITSGHIARTLDTLLNQKALAPFKILHMLCRLRANGFPLRAIRGAVTRMRPTIRCDMSACYDMMKWSDSTNAQWLEILDMVEIHCRECDALLVRPH